MCMDYMHELSRVGFPSAEVCAVGVETLGDIPVFREHIAQNTIPGWKKMKSRAKSSYDTVAVASQNWVRIEERLGKDMTEQLKQITTTSTFTKDIVKLINWKPTKESITKRVNRCVYERCASLLRTWPSEIFSGRNVTLM